MAGRPVRKMPGLLATDALPVRPQPVLVIETEDETKATPHPTRSPRRVARPGPTSSTATVTPCRAKMSMAGQGAELEISDTEVAARVVDALEGCTKLGIGDACPSTRTRSL